MARFIARVLLAALFLLAGILHLADPRLFLPIMPPWIPAPMAGILISGLGELAGGAGLLVPVRAIQRAAGWGLLLLLVAVFPANLYMAAAHVRVHGFPSHDWMSWARLPVQPLLMFLVSWSCAIWPCSAAAGHAGTTAPAT